MCRTCYTVFLSFTVDCLGSQCLFSDGECIGQIKVKKEARVYCITMHIMCTCICIFGMNKHEHKCVITKCVFFLLPSDWVFQGGCVLRKFASICSPLAVVEEKVLQLSQKTVLVMGKAKYDSQETIHTLCERTTNSMSVLYTYKLQNTQALRMVYVSIFLPCTTSRSASEKV